MTKYVINNNQKGLLFKNGKFTKVLEAGKYRTWGDSFVEVLETENKIHSENIRLNELLSMEEVASKVNRIAVGDDEIGLVFVDGLFKEYLLAGEYAYWTDLGSVEVKKGNFKEHEVSDEIPERVLYSMPFGICKSVSVPSFCVGRLCFDGRFIRFLDPGEYYFWDCDNSVKAEVIDTRLSQMTILGQEVMTSDKVLLRVSVVLNARVTDIEKALSEVDNYEEQIRTKAQLSLREYVARYTLDEILNGKEEISRYVEDALKACEEDLHVEISSAGVRDIILPGDVRDIMNTVLIAEKKAQASMIARREEVAATRSLLNTAKLMEENPTLMKLKELEYVERILSNAQNITLSGGSDVVSQLLGLVGKS